MLRLRYLARFVVTMTTQSILYEQPVNELIRVCLRLEQLLQQGHDTMRGATIWDSRDSMMIIHDVLNILDRPDLRTKLTKEFVRYLANLTRLESVEHIDQKRLSTTIIEVENVLDSLHATNGRFAQELRDNDFLNSIRQHLSNPGGASSFDVPAFHYWLQQPINERNALFHQWFAYFDQINSAISLMLRLIRQSSSAQLQTAHQGFYQTNLDPTQAVQLIRISVPTTTAVFPEISVGRHGVSLRFYSPTLKERAVLYKHDVVFKLSCCIF
jgi:cell division protein ZapD